MMKYAPVIIPTLNRADKLKACIETLARNNLALETELYISVDYPPSEKYVEGYGEVKQYLKTGVVGFKEVHIFYQEQNLGPSGNFYFLLEKVCSKFDCYIFTEDDNVFSKNFLEYINWGLTVFEDDEDVIAINGYSPPTDWISDEKGVFMIGNEFCAYGYGTWMSKLDKIEKSFKSGGVYGKLSSFFGILRVFTRKKSAFYSAVEFLNGNYPIMGTKDRIALIDYSVSIYAILEEKYIVVPVKTKVNNHGHDGSGVNSGISNVTQQKLDESEFFDIKTVCDKPSSRCNEKKMDKVHAVGNFQLFKEWIKYFLFRMGVDLQKND